MTREERLISGKLLIAIDGPSGAGKSTVTRMLADRLGYIFIDTGAMYRAVALAVRHAGLQVDDDAAVASLCSRIAVGFTRNGCCCRVLLDGDDVTDDIRTPEISLLTSLISAKKPVREMLLARQREMGVAGGVILEGRDIGTVVFPDADVKFFLSATAEERGQRRFLELRSKGEEVTLAQTIADVVQRDEQDSRREHAPLRQAADAVVIDSTGRSIEEVLTLMERVVNERRASA